MSDIDEQATRITEALRDHPVLLKAVAKKIEAILLKHKDPEPPDPRAHLDAANVQPRRRSRVVQPG